MLEIQADSHGPVLFIVIAIAGLAFGEDAAHGAIASQLSELMGRASADLVQTAVQSAGGSGAAPPPGWTVGLPQTRAEAAP